MRATPHILTNREAILSISTRKTPFKTVPEIHLCDEKKHTYLLLVQSVQQAEKLVDDETKITKLSPTMAQNPSPTI